MYEIDFYDTERILTATNEIIVERKFKGEEYNENLLPTKEYYVIEDMVNNVAIKNKLQVIELTQSTDFELIKSAWGNYFNENIDRFLRNRILGWPLSSLMFHKEKTPLIIRNDMFEGDGMCIVNFYKSEIHCFFTYINDNGDINFEIPNHYITDLGKRRTFVANIQKHLLSKKELEVRINYGSKKYSFKLFFHHSVFINNKIEDINYFNKVTGIDDLKNINDNLKVRTSFSLQDSFQMIYDKTLFDSIPHSFKKHTWLKPKLKINYSSIIKKQKNNT